MGKAKVSISCVTKFRTSVDEEKASAAALKSAVACVDAIVQKANSEIAKINECDNKCNLTLQTAHEKLEALQDELSELESRLAVTPETIWVSVSCGTDENGDTIYEEVEEPNPEYYALLNQISIVESKISRLESLINELESKIQQLSRTKQTYQGSITCLNNGKKDIISCCDNIIKKSDMASSQLQKAIMAIKKYLEETVHTERVPSHTSITWSNGSTNDNGRTIRHLESGMRATYIDDVSVTSNGRKYTSGVVVEGDLTFSNGDHTQSTVAIKRKVHQYASGIDLNYIRSDGKTNYQAMLEGEAPMVIIQTPNGEVETRLDLHHLIQEETISSPNSPFLQGTLVEIPVVSHQKHTKTIHMRYPHEDGVRRSFRVTKRADHKYIRSKDDRQFEAFKKQYWKMRATMQYEMKE